MSPIQDSLFLYNPHNPIMPFFFQKKTLDEGVWGGIPPRFKLKKNPRWRRFFASIYFEATHRVITIFSP